MASQTSQSGSGCFSSLSPFHSNTALCNNTTPSGRRPGFYSSSAGNSNRGGSELGGEKLDVIISQLSEQKQSLQQHQEQNDEILGIIHDLGSEISSLREDLHEVRSELNQLKATTGPVVKKKQLVLPRNVSVSQFSIIIMIILSTQKFLWALHDNSEKRFNPSELYELI